MKQNHIIARNTIFLYFRMLLVMAVSIYSTRVILEALGVNDFGIYQTVCGLAGSLVFINSTLATGTARFLTFELGKNSPITLYSTFSTLLIAHFFLAILVVLITELFGIVYIYNYLVDAYEHNILIIVLQLSVFSSFVSMTQIPFTSVIIAHEQMKVYAYISVIESFLKLFNSFVVLKCESDKLLTYSFLECFSQISVMFLYRQYCKRHYDESKFSKELFDINILKKVFIFCCWNGVSQIAITLVNQGIILLLNSFFSPAVVSARVVSEQIHRAVLGFLGGFRTAINPRIVKLYASNDFFNSQRLLLRSTYFSFYLILYLTLPIFFLADDILNLWLTDYNKYTVFFLKCSMIQCLFSVFDTSFYAALYAKGSLKENALLSPTISIVFFPFLYVLFWLGFSPKIVGYFLIVNYFILGIVVKPFLLCKITKYSFKDIFLVLLKCINVLFFSVLGIFFAISLFESFDNSCVLRFVVIMLSSFVTVSISILLFGLSLEDKKEIKYFLKKIYL